MRNYLLVRSAWGVRSPSGGRILSEQGPRAENYFFRSTVVPLSIPERAGPAHPVQMPCHAYIETVNSAIATPFL